MEYMSAEDANPPPVAQILCCTCGASIPPNPSNMCVNCLRGKVDITEGIPKQVVVYWCKGCHRYLQKTGVWVKAERESPELLALCLKKLKNLSKVRLVDASFIWTEPHSRRLRVRLLVQASVSEVLGGGGGAVLEQEFSVEFVEQSYMCSECHQVEARDYWRAVVQVRQRVEHKKTFLYLEQLILKHRAHTHALRIKECHDGLDFFFSSKQDARKLVDFIIAIVPSRYKMSEKLISHDTHSNTFNYKHTFSVEIVPICKDHIVCLPPKLARQMGNIGQVCVCYRVTSILYLIDPNTLQVAEIQPTVYWRSPFKALSSKNLTEFTVLQCEVIREEDKRHTGGSHSRKHILSDVWVVRSSELGQADKQIYCRTHLGLLLQPGDTVLGFDFTNTNVNDFNIDAMKADKLPDIVLVRKVFGDRNKRKKKRNWRLQRFPRISESQSEEMSGRRDDAYMEFLEELEENAELRQHIDVYKDSSKVNVELDEWSTDDDDVPKISLQEMLDDLHLDDDADEAGTSHQ